MIKISVERLVGDTLMAKRIEVGRIPCKGEFIALWDGLGVAEVTRVVHVETGPHAYNFASVTVRADSDADSAKYEKYGWVVI